MSTDSELLPCPFCGGGAILEPAVSDTCGPVVECTKCFVCQNGGSHLTDAEAITAWNRRASPIEAPGQDMVMVPKEPTHEMGLAGFYEAQKRDVSDLPLFDKCVRIYRAMLKGASNAGK